MRIYVAFNFSYLWLQGLDQPDEVKKKNHSYLLTIKSILKKCDTISKFNIWLLHPLGSSSNESVQLRRMYFIEMKMTNEDVMS